LIVKRALAVILLIFAQCVGAADPLEREIPIAIVRQPLGEALRSLAKQADLQILFDSALVAGKSAHALSGPLSARAALAALLHGTDLEAREQAAGVIVIRRRDPQ
jgi:hypothetical protein